MVRRAEPRGDAAPVSARPRDEAAPVSVPLRDEVAPVSLQPRDSAAPVSVRPRGDAAPVSVRPRTEAGPVSIPPRAPEAPRISVLPPRSLDETPATSVVVTEKRASTLGDAPGDRLSKPLLASDALMEDLAPVEPAGEAARIWCAALGAGFAVVGALPLAGLRPGGAAGGVPSLVIGAIALVAALARVTYRQRAVAMVVLGLLSGVVDLGGAHAALAAGVGGVGWGLARLVPAIALAAALIFRSRYRAYAGARIFLGAALLTAVPFTIHAVVSFSGGFGPPQIGGVVALVAVAGSLTGFMGSETTGAGPYLAWSVVLAFAAELALRALWSPGALRTPADAAHVGVAAVAFAGASILAALGLFQIAAWRFAADARRIDLHPPASRPAARQDSDVDWSTRA